MPTRKKSTASRKNEALIRLRPIVLRVARGYGARNVRVFGSFARGQQRRTSDLDLLVEMPKGSSLLDLAGSKVDLEEAIGRKVDVPDGRRDQPLLAWIHSPRRHPSMKKDPRVYLLHIRDALECIQRYTADGEKHFLGDERTQDAVIYKLAIIGEAVKKLPKSVREAQPAIPWKHIAGLRDVVIHDYDSTEVARIWKIVEKSVPAPRRPWRECW